MKKMLKFMVLPLILLCVSLLYSFAGMRHETRKIKDIKISFTDYSNPFISEKSVNKLLIQNLDSVENLYMEKLDLNGSELSLANNPMIRSAQVSVDLNGQVTALVEQRKPIARIMGGMNAYLDSDNKIMPLSFNHTALLPVVIGFDKKWQEQIYGFINYVRDDDLLDQLITQIVINKEGKADLAIRSSDVKVKFGKLEDWDGKLINLKAMLAKLEKDGMIDQVATMDLRYKDQVIVVKKKG